MLNNTNVKRWLRRRVRWPVKYYNAFENPCRTVKPWRKKKKHCCVLERVYIATQYYILCIWIYDGRVCSKILLRSNRDYPKRSEIGKKKKKKKYRMKTSVINLSVNIFYKYYSNSAPVCILHIYIYRHQSGPEHKSPPKKKKKRKRKEYKIRYDDGFRIHYAIVNVITVVLNRFEVVSSLIVPV